MGLKSKCVYQPQCHAIQINPRPWTKFNQKLSTFGINSTPRIEHKQTPLDKPIKPNQNRHSSLRPTSWIIHSVPARGCKLQANAFTFYVEDGILDVWWCFSRGRERNSTATRSSKTRWKFFGWMEVELVVHAVLRRAPELPWLTMTSRFCDEHTQKIKAYRPAKQSLIWPAATSLVATLLMLLFRNSLALVVSSFSKFSVFDAKWVCATAAAFQLKLQFVSPIKVVRGYARTPTRRAAILLIGCALTFGGTMRNVSILWSAKYDSRDAPPPGSTSNLSPR